MFPDLLRDDSFRVETPRLWLRWPRAQDVPQLVEQAGNIHVAKYTALIPHPYDVTDGQTFVLSSRKQNLLGAGLSLALTTKSGSRACIGMIGAKPGADHSASLGYWLAEPYWGNGLMGEAVDEVVALIFQVTSVAAIRAPVVRENVRSSRLLQARGFQAIGETRVSAPARQATFDGVEYAMSRASWKRYEQHRFQRPALCARRECA